VGTSFIGKESAYYLSCNKNKKSMTLNLRSDAARRSSPI